MALLTDLLTGRLLKLRLASGADVLAGISEKHLVTPKSLSDAGLVPPGSGGGSGISIPFVLDQNVFGGFTTFSPGTHYGILPSGGGTLQAKLYAYGYTDFGTPGQACLWDVAANSQVAGSTVTLDSSSAALKVSALFNVTPGKVYTYALRRGSGSSGFAYLRSALLAIQ